MCVCVCVYLVFHLSYRPYLGLLIRRTSLALYLRLSFLLSRSLSYPERRRFIIIFYYDYYFARLLSHWMISPYQNAVLGFVFAVCHGGTTEKANVSPSSHSIPSIQSSSMNSFPFLSIWFTFCASLLSNLLFYLFIPFPRILFFNSADPFILQDLIPHFFFFIF